VNSTLQVVEQEQVAAFSEDADPSCLGARNEELQHSAGRQIVHSAYPRAGRWAPLMRSIPPPLRRRLPVIGWKEYLDLPDLGIYHLKAKVDTGAHLVELSLGPDPRHSGKPLVARARLLGTVAITDSSGTPELRPLIETTLVLGAVRKPILITLTNRSGMLFRMLLGRTAIAGDFRVDVARKYLLRRRNPPPGLPEAP
jgi:hypothetical protein